MSGNDSEAYAVTNGMATLADEAAILLKDSQTPSWEEIRKMYEENVELLEKLKEKGKQNYDKVDELVHCVCNRVVYHLGARRASSSARADGSCLSGSGRNQLSASLVGRRPGRPARVFGGQVGGAEAPAERGQGES